jgi:hypothetical protein
MFKLESMSEQNEEWNIHSTKSRKDLLNAYFVSSTVLD